MGLTVALRRDGRSPFRGLKVGYTPQFEKWFLGTKRELRFKALKLVERMRDSIKQSQDGVPKIGRVKSLKGVEIPIYEARLTGDIRLLYNVQKKENKDPLLMLLDVSDHDYLSRTASRSADHLVHASRLDGLQWENEELILAEFPLESPRIHKSSGEIISKDFWDNLNDKEKNDFKILEGRELDNELRKWMEGRAPVIGPGDEWTKEYTDEAFEGAAIYTMVYSTASEDDLRKHQDEMIKTGKLHPHLSLDQSQLELTSEDSQVFILEGVAGTGKTTILERRFIRYIEGGGSFATSVFLTHSKALAKSVKTGIKKYFSENESAEIDACIMDLETWCKKIIQRGRKEFEINERVTKIEGLEENLDSLKETIMAHENDLNGNDQSVRILTGEMGILRKNDPEYKNKERRIRKLLNRSNECTRLIESVRKEVEKKRKEIDEEGEKLAEQMEKSDSESSHITEKYSAERKIDYNRFAKIITEIGGTKIDSGILWEEYRGVILGAGFDNLNENDYVNLSRDRIWSRDKKLRSEAYQEISKIVRRLERSKGGFWTDQDIAKDVWRYSEKNEGGVDAIFVDEIQDLTELQVTMLLQNLDNNGRRKFEVAGDTSQSVHPSAFRWEDLRRAVSEILEIKLPKHHKMNTNYRATPYLIKSANLFLEEHDKILGINSDELQRPAAKDNGIHPCIIRLNESQIISALTDLDLPNAFCPLVIREDSDIPRFKKELGGDGKENVHVLSVRGSKGLEYENVILWDIFSGSSRLLDNYHHHIRGKEHSKKKESIAIELRHVFVGITRARYRLAIVSPQTKGSHSIESAADWLQTMDDIFTLEGMSFLSEFTKKDATPEDYLIKAEEFEGSGRWDMAADAYSSAGKDLDMLRCRGMYLKEQGRFEEAASAFQEAKNKALHSSKRGYMLLEAECLDLAIASDPANMELLEHRASISAGLGDDDSRSRTMASICESRAANTQGEDRSYHLQQAAKHWREIDEIEKAVNIYLKLGQYTEVAIYSLKLVEPPKSKFFSKAIEEILKASGRRDLIFDMYNGGGSWRKQVAKALRLNVKEIPIIEKDTDQAIKYAEGDQKLELELTRAKDSGNWRNEATTLLKMKRTDEAVDLYIEREKYTLALYAILKNYDDSTKDYLEEVVPMLLDTPEDEKILINAAEKQKKLHVVLSVFPVHDWVTLGDQIEQIGTEEYFWQIRWLRDVSGLRRVTGKIFHPIEDRIGRATINHRLMSGIDKIIDAQLFRGNLKRVSEICNFGLNYIQYICEWDDGKYVKEISKSDLLRTIWYITKATELCGGDLRTMGKINEKWLLEFYKALIQNESQELVMLYWREFAKIERFRGFSKVNKLISMYVKLNIIVEQLQHGGLTKDDLIDCGYQIGTLLERIEVGYYPRIDPTSSVALQGYLDSQIGEKNIALIVQKGESDKARLEKGIPSSEIKPPPQKLTEEIAGWIRPVEVPLRVEEESWLDKISGTEIQDHIELKPEIEDEIEEELPAEKPGEEVPEELDLILPEFEEVTDSKYNLDLQPAIDAITSEEDPVKKVEDFIRSEISDEDGFLLEFIELRDGWDETIAQQWASSDEFRVELLACKQALIEITKKEDRLQTYSYSRKTLDVQNQRTRDNYLDISKHKFIVSNRWMNN